MRTTTKAVEQTASELVEQVAAYFNLPRPPDDDPDRPTVKTQWFCNAAVQIYLRYGHRLVKGQFVRGITIANVTVERPRCGVFTEIVKRLWLLLPPGEMLVIENVMTRAMRGWLGRPFYQPWRLLESAGAPQDETYYAIKDSSDVPATQPNACAGGIYGTAHPSLVR